MYCEVWLGGKKYNGFNDGFTSAYLIGYMEDTRCCDKHHEKVLKNEWPFGKINEKLEERVIYNGKYHIWDLSA